VKRSSNKRILAHLPYDGHSDLHKEQNNHLQGSQVSSRMMHLRIKKPKSCIRCRAKLIEINEENDDEVNAELQTSSKQLLTTDNKNTGSQDFIFSRLVRISNPNLFCGIPVPRSPPQNFFRGCGTRRTEGICEGH